VLRRVYEKDDEHEHLLDITAEAAARRRRVGLLSSTYPRIELKRGEQGTYGVSAFVVWDVVSDIMPRRSSGMSYIVTRTAL